MGLSLAQLRFLAYHRKVSKTSHYHHFYIPKKSGGQRLISAPKKNLKKVQKWILENILYKIQNQDVVHGFVPKHSIKTNALPHLQKEVVINIDLKDFFPSISYKRVKGLFQKLGYSEQIATIFTLLCTHFEVDKVNVDGVAYYVQKTERFLPQGSPASPAITNLIAHTLDLRLQGLAKKYDFTYTRYADDLTFSSNTINEKSIKTLMSFVQSIVNEEDFTIHPDKTHIMRRGSQKKVTGVVVNEKLNVDRAILHKFRALLHQIEKTGWEGKSWGNSSNLWMSMTGFVSYVMMVNPEKGNRLKEKMIQLAKKQEFNPKEKVSNPKKDNQNEIPSPNTPTPPSQPNEQGKKDWWDIFE
jgi:retron-type reverse transcriptase